MWGAGLGLAAARLEERAMERYLGVGERKETLGGWLFKEIYLGCRMELRIEMK